MPLDVTCLTHKLNQSMRRHIALNCHHLAESRCVGVAGCGWVSVPRCPWVCQGVRAGVWVWVCVGVDGCGCGWV